MKVSRKPRRGRKRRPAPRKGQRSKGGASSDTVAKGTRRPRLESEREQAARIEEDGW